VSESNAAQILLKAVNGLSKEDRDEVMLWVLDRSFGRPPFTGMQRDLIEKMPTLAPPSLEELKAGTRRGEHQVVPIRLPSEQHAALRDWCTEHGFSMATVVRGLVERFLEEQGAGSAVAREAQD
jgi:hypothetical protein